MAKRAQKVLSEQVGFKQEKKELNLSEHIKFYLNKWDLNQGKHDIRLLLTNVLSEQVGFKLTNTGHLRGNRKVLSEQVGFKE